MGFEVPQVPPGSGKHAIAMVVISANRLAESGGFYTKLFGWPIQAMSAELAGFTAPAGPFGALRAKVPEGFPGVVPFLGVSDVAATLEQVEAKGGSVERAPWSVPGVGKLARFKDPGGTIYGLLGSPPPGASPTIPMPFGTNPKPPAGSICSVEMYAADGPASAAFFADLFGWGTLPTMPQYVAFHPGAGVGGVWQSHTPALPALAYVYVPDVAAKLAEIDAAGGKRTADPMPLPGFGTFGYFTDPSGTHMGLIGE